MLNKSLEAGFQNIEIAFGIYLSLMITNCSDECSFITLKRVKDELRKKMTQERLNHPTLINIEYDWLRDADIDSNIFKLAQIKFRKVCL